MIRRCVHLFIVSSLFTWMQLSIAAAPAAELAKLLSGFTTMSAHFTQTLADNNGNITQRSSGSMALQRPGKFRWQVDKPNPQLLIADGRYLWIYDVELQQATRENLDYKNSSTPAFLLSGSVENLQKRFAVTRLKGLQKGIGFELQPRTKNDMFQWVKLYFENNQLSSMQLSDNLGQFSDFNFTNVNINSHLSAGLFQFTAPKDVDIIKN